MKVEWMDLAEVAEWGIQTVVQRVFSWVDAKAEGKAA